MVSRRYQRRLDDYLRWRSDDDCLFRPAFDTDPSGPSAAEAMLAWESTGKPLGSTREPDLLADYVQGKRSRDWHITEWRQGVKQGYFLPVEFVGAFGLTKAEVAKIFGISETAPCFDRMLWR